MIIVDFNLSTISQYGFCLFWLFLIGVKELIKLSCNIECLSLM